MFLLFNLDNNLLKISLNVNMSVKGFYLNGDNEEYNCKKLKFVKIKLIYLKAIIPMDNHCARNSYCNYGILILKTGFCFFNFL